jgi:hypothetical protein
VIDRLQIPSEYTTSSIRDHHADEGLRIEKVLDYSNGTTTRPRRTKVKGALLLNIIIGEGATVLKLFASKNKALLVGWDTLLVLNLRFHIINSVRRFNFERDSLARQSLDEYLHAATKTKN